MGLSKTGLWVTDRRMRFRLMVDACVARLGESGDPAVLPLLLRAVADGGRYSEPATVALKAFGELGRDALIGAFRQEQTEPARRQRIGVAMTGFGGGEVVDALVGALSEPNASGWLMELLQSLPRTDMTRIAEHARRTNVEGLRFALGSLLIRVLGKAAVSFVEEIGENARGRELLHYAEFLAEQGRSASWDMLRRLLREPDWKVRHQALRIAGEHAVGAILPDVYALLTEQGARPDMAWHLAGELLAKHADRALPLLVQGVRNESCHVRSLCCQALGKCSRPDLAVPALMPLLVDPVLYVRMQALDALRAHGWAPAGADGPAYVAYASGNWEALAALPSLPPAVVSSAMASGNEEARAKMLTCLGNKDPGAVAKLLIPALDAEDPKQVVDVLVGLGADAGPCVVAALADPRERIRRHAAVVAGRLALQHAVLPLLADAEKRGPTPEGLQALVALGWKPKREHMGWLLECQMWEQVALLGEPGIRALRQAVLAPGQPLPACGSLAFPAAVGLLVELSGKRNTAGDAVKALGYVLAHSAGQIAMQDLCRLALLDGVRGKGTRYVLEHLDPNDFDMVPRDGPERYRAVAFEGPIDTGGIRKLARNEIERRRSSPA